MENKRHNYIMKDFLVPIIAGVVLGGLTAMLTVKYNEGESNEWRKNVERRLVTFEVILSAVQVNQIEIATQSQRMISSEQRIEKVERDITMIMADNYTKTSADKDIDRIMREIKLRHGGN